MNDQPHILYLTPAEYKRLSPYLNTTIGVPVVVIEPLEVTGMNDAFRFCSGSPDDVLRSEGDQVYIPSLPDLALPDASRPLATELDTDASGVVHYPGAEEVGGRADVPLAGTPQAPDENPGNKPPQTVGASEGI